MASTSDDIYTENIRPGEMYKLKWVEEYKSPKQVGGDHYQHLNPQPWDILEAWNLGWCASNVIKYVARHRQKNGLEDLKKARHYLDKLIADYKE